MRSSEIGLDSDDDGDSDSDLEVEDSDESSDEDDEDVGNAATVPTPPTSVFPSNPAACMREVLGAAVSSVGKLAAAPRKTQEKLTGALHARRRERMLLSVEAGGLAPARDEAVRLLSSSDEGGAWLRAIPYDPSVRLANGAFRGAVAFRLGVPQRRLQRGPDTCDCHRAHDERARVARARAQRRVRNRGRRRRQRRQRRRPKRVDGRGEHDMTCAYGNPHGRHARYQAALVSAGKDANQLVRHTTVRELRVETDSRSQKQADVAIDLFGPEQVTALADFVVCHPTAATYVNSYGQSGDAAKKVAAKKVKKYGALATQLGYKFIPFAAETYGKMGEAALQVVRTLGSAAAEESAPRPWHARSFADATVQRLSVALQRGVQEDQLLRAHVRRTRHLFGVNDGGAPGGGAATESVVARAGAARRAECRSC